jgi:hypothetical protein
VVVSFGILVCSLPCHKGVYVADLDMVHPGVFAKKSKKKNDSGELEEEQEEINVFLNMESIFI